MKKYLSAIIAMAALAAGLLLGAAMAQAQVLPITQTATVRINWADNSTNENNFNIFRCTGTAAVPTCVPTLKVASTGPDVVEYSDRILNDPGNTPLCYALDASNDAGASPKTSTACIRTAAIIAVKVAPNAPTGIRTSIVAVSIP